jgi:hypothetical protein
LKSGFYQNNLKMFIMKKVFRYFGIGFLLIIGTLTITVLVVSCRSNLAVIQPKNNQEVYFNGTLLAVSDADQIGTAYADGVVNKQSGVEDSLTIIKFSKRNEYSKTAIHATNSVVSWPSVLANSKDGRFAYIAETRGAFTTTIDKVKNVWTALPKGSVITVVDLETNQIVQKKEMGTNLTSASVNFDGTLLATASTDGKNEEIVVGTLKNGLIENVFRQKVEGVRQDVGSDSGIKTVEFSPTENVLAVNLHTEDLAFFQVKKDSLTTKIEPIGQPIKKVATCWSVGNWTPKGKFFIISDVAWGDGDMGAVFNKEGSLLSVAYDAKGLHKVISKAMVGLSPEGFDISPDGNWAIVSNMRRTYLPAGLPFALFPASKQASLSLVKINNETGELKVIGKEYGFEGELPEDTIFDKDSKTIAVAIYNERFNRQPKNGFIEFWTLENEKLIKTNLKIPVTRGVHNLKLVN